MIQARANDPLHANLPEYIVSGEQTKARDIVAGLTDLPAEKYIRYLDANVEASRRAPVQLLRLLETNL